VTVNGVPTQFSLVDQITDAEANAIVNAQGVVTRLDITRTRTKQGFAYGTVVSLTPEQVVIRLSPTETWTLPFAATVHVVVDNAESSLAAVQGRPAGDVTTFYVDADTRVSTLILTTKPAVVNPT